MTSYDPLFIELATLIKSKLELQIKILKDMFKIFRNVQNCIPIRNIPDSIHASIHQSEHVHKLLSRKYVLEWRSDSAYVESQSSRKTFLSSN